MLRTSSRLAPVTLVQGGDHAFPSQQELDRMKDIEDDIRDVVGTVATSASLSLPDYVTHQDGVGEVGKITSAALVKQYEQAAKSIEEMGRRLVDSVKQNEEQVLTIVRGLEEYRSKAESAVKQCEDAAKKYRDEAARVFSLVQRSSSLADEVSSTCGTLVDKITS